MQKNRLFKSTAVIAFFGIGGTLVSFALLSLVASLLGFQLQYTLMLGAVMSATDSVAVLSILSPHDQPLLHSIVFGEGVLNDASSIVLLRTVKRTFASMADASEEVIVSETVLTIVFSFFWTFTVFVVCVTQSSVVDELG